MLNIIQSFEPLILAVHFMVCIFMMVVILLQAGKGADMGAAFGAGSSQTLFGARGAATLLSKVTTVVAGIFLLTSISLATIHRNRPALQGTSTVLDQPAPEALPSPVETDVGPGENTPPAAPAPSAEPKTP